MLQDFFDPLPVLKMEREWKIGRKRNLGKNWIFPRRERDRD